MQYDLLIDSKLYKLDYFIYEEKILFYLGFNLKNIFKDYFYSIEYYFILNFGYIYSKVVKSERHI